MTEPAAARLNRMHTLAAGNLPGLSARALHFLHKAFWVAFIIGIAGGTNILQANSYRFFWAAAYLYIFFAALIYPRGIVDLIRRNALLFVWPAMAMLSTLWSQVPAISLQHGFQLAMTVLIGLVVVEIFGFPRLLRMLFAALLISALASLAAVLVNLPGARFFYGEWQGIFPHKNVLGAHMVLLAMTSASLFFTRGMKLLSLGAFVLAVVLVVRSESGTALLCLALVCCFIGGLVVRHRLPSELSVVTTCAIIALPLILMMLASATDYFSLILESLGKDTTLTGRTVLWDYALGAIQQNPFFGLGFNAFWYTPAAEEVHYLVDQPLFAFHNNYLEILVSLGAMGLLAYLFVLGAVLFAATRRMLTQPDLWSLWTVVFFLYLLIFGFSESAVFFPHTLKQFLVACAAAHTLPGIQSSSRAT